MPFNLDQPDARLPALGMGQSQNAGSLGGMFGTLGGLMQVREMQAQEQQRRQQAEQQRRALEDDSAIRATLPRFGTPDEAIQDLYRQGRATAAAKLGTSIYDQRKAQAEDYGQRAKAMGDSLTQMTQMLQGVTDDSTYQPARRAIIQMGQGIFGPAIADYLPTTYDKPKVDALTAWGTKRSDQLTAEHQAAQDLLGAYKEGAITNPYAPGGQLAGKVGGSAAGPQYSESAQKVWDGYLKAASRVLPLAIDKTQWDAYVQTLRSQGAPDSVIQQLPQWDDQNPNASREAAKKLGLTQKEQADITNAQEQRKQEGIRLGYEGRRVAVEEDKAKQEPPQKPLTPDAQSAVDARRNTRNMQLDAKFVKDNPDFTTNKTDDQAMQKAQQKWAAQRVQIENGHRNESRMPTFEEAAQTAIENNDRASYDVLAKKYLATTAGLQSLDDVGLSWPSTTAKKGQDVNLPNEGRPGASVESIPRSAPATLADRQKRIDELTGEFYSADPVRQQAIKNELLQLRAR